MKRAEEARYAETENLHRENDTYKQELAYIHQTYELDSLDDKLRSAQKTEQWAESILGEIGQLFNAVESHMTCTICNKVMTHEGPLSPMMILPCQHSLCQDCQQGKRKKLGTCACCGGKEASVTPNLAMVDLADKYHYFKPPLTKRLEWMRLRISKGFSNC